MCVIMEVLRNKICCLPTNGPHLLHATRHSLRSLDREEVRLIRPDWNFPPIDGAVLCESERGLV